MLIELLMTKQGIPIGRQVFPGNMHDTKTFGFEDMKKRYPIDKVLLVGDRGMVSEENWCGFYLTCIRYYKKLSEQFVQSLKVPDT